MGQAKKRGTYEERKALAVPKRFDPESRCSGFARPKNIPMDLMLAGIMGLAAVASLKRKKK